jgi:hypothetical protein
MNSLLFLSLLSSNTFVAEKVLFTEKENLRMRFFQKSNRNLGNPSNLFEILLEKLKN